MAAINSYYDNFFLSNEIEDQYASHLDMQQFVTVDNSLTGVAGMKRKVNVYSATNGTQKLGIGEGNDEAIVVSYVPREYDIVLAQNRFRYLDEEAMADPMVVATGVRHAGVDMFNTVNSDVYAEYKKAPQVVVATALGFNPFADAQAMLNVENLEDTVNFAFVCPADVAALRKALGQDLKYVESFARAGYIGTVAGCNIYTKKDATRGTVVLATKEAVTIFNKKGVEVEQERSNANTRENTVYSRKYYVAALTDETKAVQIILGSASATQDTTASADKTYYAASGLGYVAVVPKEGDNPKTKGWFEITATSF